MPSRPLQGSFVRVSRKTGQLANNWKCIVLRWLREKAASGSMRLRDQCGGGRPVRQIETLNMACSKVIVRLLIFLLLVLFLICFLARADLAGDRVLYPGIRNYA